MGLRDSLEGRAKKWALDKAHELMGDKSAETAAAPAAPAMTAVEQQALADAQARAGEKVVRSMLPGLSRWADDQQRQIGQQQAADAAKQRSSIAALPKAEVTIQLTGALQAQWSGQLPVKIEIRPGITEPEAWQANDPMVGEPSYVLELTPQADQRPQLAQQPMAAWRVSVPGFHGDGTYDLVALTKQRQVTGFDVPYDENWLDLDGDDGGGDYQFYFNTDVGSASVTVGGGGTRISAAVSMGGAVGNVVGTLEVTIPSS